MVYERQFDFRAGLQRFDEVKRELEFYVMGYWKSHIVPFGIGQLFFINCGADEGVIVIDKNSPKSELENVGNYRINVSTSSKVLNNGITKYIELILKNNNVERIVR